ncbi:polysaccharide lyase family 7 protein [Tenacibaculum agarivorans]|uniref:polysaccharide lyase family 7 protein n=1 Tax=Tenacibaculum agarivorans TaxID=1908389 RepID=UPI00094BA5B4|nr:polysaccharide lyase family 7 protein [Tenacibaculum agarivorans]
MKNILKNIVSIVIIIFMSANAIGQNNSISDLNVEEKRTRKKKRNKKIKLPKIDLSHWKVTIPEGKSNGRPYEFQPPEIFDYANNTLLKKYMYNDSIKGALVFYATPQVTTSNTKYSRSELREQMKPGDNTVNWTFKEGGRMKGKLSIGEISKNKKGEYHKTIVMQIHGRLTNEQKELIGQKDNNAPPILKIYWKNGKIRVKTKVLKNLNATDKELLHKDAWGDDKGFTFKEKVGFKKFTLEVKVTDGKMVVSLNNNEFKVYDNVHMKRWRIFENYFKAGNYFQTRDKEAYAKVNYYELKISH